MKKNRMMRVASALLVAVLLTTCTISGTFAKYVTTDSATDTARVAKWGVTVSVNGNLFGTDYAENGATENEDSIIASSTNVHSSATVNNIENVVAPGTENQTGLKIALSGTPEVAYEISATTGNVTAEEIFLSEGSWGVMVPAFGLNAETNFYTNTYYIVSDDGKTYTEADKFTANTPYFELIDEATVGAGGYYPIDWTVTTVAGSDTTPTFTDIAATRLADIQTAMISNFSGKTFLANDNADGSYVLTWKWDYNNGNDGADTILGDLAAGSVVVKLKDGNYTSDLEAGVGKDYNLENMFGIEVTVTQVD